MAVHPHTRGEHEAILKVVRSRVGSSPHSWGTLRRSHAGGREARFIPTLVGNTMVWAISARRLAVHPHTRGEHAGRLFACGASGGSSPHSWGTQRIRRLSFAWGRFIPTLVGNTAVDDRDQGLGAVHPHTRGEHTDSGLRKTAEVGSSPHSWGTLSATLAGIARSRFIPTLVGNTNRFHQAQSPRTVHPHTRGEHSVIRVRYGAKCGSSPHSWGTQPKHRKHFLLCRFIPTLVGNTKIWPFRRFPTPVHPHTRGEHPASIYRKTSAPGSSPHSWGTRFPSSFGFDISRFIPTLVGNTMKSDSMPDTRAVHPHTRGEHLIGESDAQRIAGSSPHSWGTLRASRCVPVRGRFIPTLVGNTR